MTENVHIWLSDAESTEFCGTSLSKTLYSTPVEIGFSGEIGAGKTTFMRGFLYGLGHESHVTSPTYALEQHYDIAKEGKTLHLHHIDLYRLTGTQAEQFVVESDNTWDIRCIEWTERLKNPQTDIQISLSESSGLDGRSLNVTFNDVLSPSEEKIMEWRERFRLPKHIARHCDAVADVTKTLCAQLHKQGMLCRFDSIYKAALVHDLFRFVDFRAGAAHVDMCPSEEDQRVWQHVKEAYPNLQHEPALAAFLRDEGYTDFADIVETHGFSVPNERRQTTEQKVLFYADKRVSLDIVVTVEERFEDFAARYSNGKVTPERKRMHEETLIVQKELFPEGEPEL